MDRISAFHEEVPRSISDTERFISQYFPQYIVYDENKSRRTYDDWCFNEPMTRVNVRLSRHMLTGILDR